MYAHGGLRRIGVTLILQAPAGKKFSETNRVTYECEKHCVRGFFAYLTDIQDNINLVPEQGALHPLCTVRNRSRDMTQHYKDYCLKCTGCNAAGEYFGRLAATNKDLAALIKRDEPAPAPQTQEREEALAEADERNRQSVGLRLECWPPVAIRQDIELFCRDVIKSGPRLELQVLHGELMNFVNPEHRYFEYYRLILERYRAEEKFDGEVPPPPTWTPEDEAFALVAAAALLKKPAAPKEVTEPAEEGEEVSTRCEHCPKWFKSRAAMEMHLWSKAGEQLHPALREEEKATYGSTNSCPHCTKWFETSSQLDCHL